MEDPLSYIQDIIDRSAKSDASVDRATRTGRSLAGEKLKTEIARTSVRDTEKKALDAGETVSASLNEEQKLRFKKRLKDKLRSEKDYTMRRRMAKALVDSAYLLEDEVEEVMKEIDVLQETLDKIYNDMGDQRDIAEQAIMNGHVTREEAEKTIFKSIHDQVLEEYVIGIFESANALLEWFRDKRGELSDGDDFDSIKNDIESARTRWRTGTQAVRDAMDTAARTARRERAGKSETFRIKEVSFNIDRAKKLLIKLRTDMNLMMSDGVTPWTWNLTVPGNWCAGGVSAIFYDSTGVQIWGDGNEWGTRMRHIIESKLVPYKESDLPEHKTEPPEGAVLVWDDPGQNHCALVIGEYWVSDFTSAHGAQFIDPVDPTCVFILE